MQSSTLATQPSHLPPGKRLADNLYAERIGDGRYMIRQNSPRLRLGEVFGSGSVFIAERLNGQFIKRGRTLLEAASALQSSRTAASPWSHK